MSFLCTCRKCQLFLHMSKQVTDRYLWNKADLQVWRGLVSYPMALQVQRLLNFTHFMVVFMPRFSLLLLIGSLSATWPCEKVAAYGGLTILDRVDYWLRMDKFVGMVWCVGTCGVRESLILPGTRSMEKWFYCLLVSVITHSFCISRTSFFTEWFKKCTSDFWLFEQDQ